MFPSEVLGVRGVTEFDGRDVLFVESNQKLSQPRRPPNANYQDTSGERIQSPCVSDTTLPSNAANARDHVVRRDSFRLVDYERADHRGSVDSSLCFSHLNLVARGRRPKSALHERPLTWHANGNNQHATFACRMRREEF